jgi:hypothetical protein
VLGSRRLVARSRSLSERLGFLKDERDDFEDLVDVGEDADEQGWVPLRDGQYRRRRGARPKSAAFADADCIMGVMATMHPGDGPVSWRAAPFPHPG